MRGQITHLDTDVLADFEAGLITGRRAAAVTAHLAGCARCAAVADELAGVSALFAAAPPPAMPDRVALQLDAALAAEVAQRNNDAERFRGTPQREPAIPVAAAKPPAHRTRRPRRAGHGGGFRWLSPHVLAPVGVVAVLAVGGYFATKTSPHYEGPTSVAAPAAGSAAGHSSSPALAGPAGGAVSRQQQVTPNMFTVVVSPVDFRAATLSQQLAADLRVPVTARTTHTASATVTGCVHRVAAGAAVLRVESARYEGQPVTVVVTRAGQGEKAQLAGPGCSAASSHVLAARTVSSGISGP
jgi:hypothetical protein